MKKIFMTFGLLALMPAVFGAQHAADGGLILEKRQADTVMTIINVDLGEDETIISAKGKNGVYGTVYITYRLSYHADGKSGFATGSGLGAIDADTVMFGRSSGIWTRDGSIITIRQLVQVSDGIQNLDTIDIDMRKDTFVLKVYALQ